MSLFGIPGKDLILYEEHRHYVWKGEFGTHITVISAPAELHPALMTFALAQGYTTVNGYLTVRCTRLEFEQFLEALAQNDLNAMLTQGLNFMTPQDADDVRAFLKSKYEAALAESKPSNE